MRRKERGKRDSRGGAANWRERKGDSRSEKTGSSISTNICI